MAKSKSPPKKSSSEDLGEALRGYVSSAKVYTPKNLTPTALWGVVLWAIVPLLLGIWLSNKIVTKPAVGIITLETGISSFTAELLTLQIEEARRDPAIRAVVFKMNTPGGSVTPTQQVYFELLDLRESMPVVASIDFLAASGGYYLAMAADPIFAKPSSIVGNIGVWGRIPRDLAVNDLVLASGPFKLSAINQAEFVREIEGIKREFLEVVKAGRGDRLKMSDDEVTTGLAYPAREAVALGLVDYLGSESEAIDMAAEMAGLRYYSVVDLEQRVLLELFEDDSPNFEPWVYSKNPLTEGFNLPSGAYMLYDVLLGGLQ